MCWGAQKLAHLVEAYASQPPRQHSLRDFKFGVVVGLAMLAGPMVSRNEGSERSRFPGPLYKGSLTTPCR